MSAEWLIALVSAGGFSLACCAFFALAFHALYLYKRYRHNLDTYLMGDWYFNGGFLYWWLQRLALYTGGAMFPSYIKHIPLINHSRFETIDSRVRTHLLWHGWLMTATTLLFLFSACGLYAYSECWIGETTPRCNASEAR